MSLRPVRFVLAYRPTRQSANNTDIKITITAVKRTSRSANKRRIATSLDKTVALGVILRHRHLHLAQSLFDRIHHDARSADEVLVVSVRRRHVAPEHLRAN